MYTHLCIKEKKNNLLKREGDKFDMQSISNLLNEPNKYNTCRFVYRSMKIIRINFTKFYSFSLNGKFSVRRVRPTQQEMYYEI